MGPGESELNMASSSLVGNQRADYSGHEDANEIRRDIEHARHEMDETLEELGERLTLPHLMESAKDYARTTTAQTTEQMKAKIRSAAHQVTDKIKEFPMAATAISAGIGTLSGQRIGTQLRHNISGVCTTGQVNQGGQYTVPAALMGAGLLVWAYQQSRHASGRSSYGTVSENQDVSGDRFEDACATSTSSASASGVAHRASEALHGLTSGTRHVSEAVANRASEALQGAATGTRRVTGAVAERASDVLHSAASGTRRMGERASEMGSHAEESIERGYRVSRDVVVHETEEHPFAAGAAILGLGLAAGFLLPRTRTEDRLLGETADSLKEQAREIAELGKGVAQATGQAAYEQVREEAKDIAEEIASRGKKIAETTSQVAMEEAQRQGIATQSGGSSDQPATTNAGEGSMTPREKDSAAAIGQAAMREAATQGTTGASCDVQQSQQHH
jgi:gas vesicle protein